MRLYRYNMLQPLPDPHNAPARLSTYVHFHQHRHASKADIARTHPALLSGSCLLVACVTIFAANTLHWPLSGDAALMRYISFLMDHGRVPYRQIDDMNLPGSYLVDYAVLHLLGSSSLVWRIFDLGLTAVAAVAMMSIARPYGWFSGLSAAALLTLIHGQDGIFELGQRDLVVAVLVLLAYATFFQATRKESPRWMLAFGISASLATTIKPIFIFFGVALLLVMVAEKTKRQQTVSSFAYYGIVGLLLPLAATATFLSAMHASTDFISVMTGLLPFHTGLARKPLGFLLLHSFSPLLPLVLLWIPCLRTQWRRWGTFEGKAMLIGLTFGLVSYIAQGKGFSYHRYPFLAMLLMIMSIDCYRSTQESGWARPIGWVGIAFGALILAPLCTIKASRYDWHNNEFSEMLQSDLLRLSGGSVSGHVQCIDTIGGCFSVLYDLRALQRDRFIYDEFLFNATENQAVLRARESFFEELRRKPPQLLVVTDDLFPSGPNNFQKVKQWPKFASYLKANYFQCAQGRPPHTIKWWSREQQPSTYQILCYRPGI